MGVCLGGIAWNGRTGGAFRCATKIQMDSPHQRAVATIRERSDHQSVLIADVFVGIQGHGVDHLALDGLGQS